MYSILSQILKDCYADYNTSSTLPKDILLLCLHYLLEEHYTSTEVITKRWTMFNGVIHGEEKIWEHGRLVYIHSYRYGKRHGLVMDFYYLTTSIAIWSQGVQRYYKLCRDDYTPMIEYQYNQNGDCTVIKDWYDNGRLKYICRRKNLKLHGLSKQWYENGNVEYEIMYENGNILWRKTYPESDAPF